MSWAIFKSEYKKGLNNDDDMATVIADAYDKCVKLGTANPPGIGPMASVNLSGLKSQLNAAFKSRGKYKLDVALQVGLTLYWLGGATAGGSTVVAPGIFSGYLTNLAKNSKDVDEYCDYLIECFNRYHNQVSFLTPATTPIPSVGYKVSG
tara:strand:- start:23 stop:472 length:450 start_codon:yes stop_codon:yes gene_type:complete